MMLDLGSMLCMIGKTHILTSYRDLRFSYDISILVIEDGLILSVWIGCWYFQILEGCEQWLYDLKMWRTVSNSKLKSQNK